MRLIDADTLIENICDKKSELTKLKGSYKYLTNEEKDDWDSLDDFQDLVDNQTVVFDSCSKKYQEALDIIKETEDENYTIESVWSAIDTLQELINKLIK